MSHIMSSRGRRTPTSTASNVVTRNMTSSIDFQVTSSRSVINLANTCGDEAPAVKRVTRGFREAIVPRTCGILMFEAKPAWLWAARLSDFSRIYITVQHAQILRQEFASTWEHVSDKLKLCEGKEILNVKVDMWLLSGSRSFLGNLGGISPHIPMVAWAYPIGRAKPPSTVGSVWVSVCHSQVGGATNITGVFWFRNLPAFQVEADPITRTIEHIIKHSERPMPCTPESASLSLHYRLSDRLSSHHLDRPVLMPTSFSRTGWGQRKLIASELGHAFDLPSFIPWDDCFQGTLVPLQLLRVALDHALLSASVSLEGPLATTDELDQSFRDLVAQSVVADVLFLPDLMKWLPGSWADAPIASKAVKSDDARVNFSPWHRRISLVLPCSSATIEMLERFCMRLWCRKVTTSFRLYLVTTYGLSWARRLWAYRRGGPGGQRRSADEALDGADAGRRFKKARRCEIRHDGGDLRRMRRILSKK
jgi:hypothetical protein